MYVPRPLALATLFTAFAVSTAAFAQVKPTSPGTQAQPCHIDDLAVSTDSKNGDFDGMSHSGTLIILRNISKHSCQVPPFPKITLADATHALGARAEVPGGKFMHPGPVVLPTTLAPGKEVVATMRWVDGPVYTDSLCITATKLVVTLQDLFKTTDLHARICSDRAKGVTFTLTRFSPPTPAAK